MTSAYVVGYDAIRVNIGSLPKGAQIYAGYSTGSGYVPWTAADFTAHATALGPCLRIDQDPAASDPTADILDVERGAATVGDCAWWAKRALASVKAAKRPGQRRPAIYMSASNVTAVVNALVSGGVTSGVGLFIANWSLTVAQAAADVLAAAGPFPIVGVQFRDDGPFDTDVFNRAWLLDQSGRPVPPPAPPKPPPARPVPAWQEHIMNALPTLSAGADDTAGHVFYVHRAQALTKVYGGFTGLAEAAGLEITGIFNAATKAAVEQVQSHAKITADGVVGPHTWSVLITGAA